MPPKRKQDHYTRQAKAAGYPARSVYKLEEIDQRVGLLKPNMHVLDLGASPGSWTLHAAKQVGHGGQVLAVDLNPLHCVVPNNVRFIQNDIFAVDPATEFGAGVFDVVLSDMAPATTGQRQADQYRSYELVMQALTVAQICLKPGGALLAKIFQGPDLQTAKTNVSAAFTRTRLLRPKATRRESYELFIYGEALKGPEIS